MQLTHRRFLIGWLFTGCALIFLMVILGGITRLTHSGLSMVDWHLVLGSLPPFTEADWQEPFRKYQQSPEFQQLNAHYTIKEFKQIYWWEYTHRLLGRIIGLVFLLPFLYLVVRWKLSRPLLLRLLVLLALGAFQGVLGWYMVKSGLVKNPYVSHYRLAAHLISAFTLFGFTFWLALQLLFPKTEIKQQRPQMPRQLGKLPLLARALLGVTVVQIIYGAFVAGLRAGLSYNTFPKMGAYWISPDAFALQPLWLNFLEGGAGVQLVHRYLAIIVVALAVFMYRLAKDLRLHPLQRVALFFVLAMVALQFYLGVTTLLLAVPVWLGVLHQAGAFLLFAAVLLLCFQLKAGSRKKSRTVAFSVIKYAAP